MFDIERYLNVRSAHGASVGPDGDRLAFLMDTTGVPQVWTLDAPGGWPEQRTFFDDRVTFAAWSPERHELLVGRDRGGDEREAFYRLDVADGSITDLTEHPDAKHWFGGWRPDGEQFAFASNRRDHAVFDVYVQDRDATGADAVRVHEGDGWLSVSGWSPDGDRLLLTESHSSFDQDLYVLDVETGDRRHLTPHEGDVRYLSAAWGPEGEGVYLATDRDADTLSLARIDLATGECSRVTAADPDGEGDGPLADDAWNVDGVAVDEDSRRLVYSRNVDGYTELGVGELVAPGRLDHFPSPDLPPSVAGGVSFGPDGDRFALTVTRSDDTANVYVVDVTTGDAERWTRASTAGIPRDTFVAPELVRYPSFDGREIPAFFSLPETDTGHGETPVVVDVHGGPESQRRPSFGRVKQYLLSRGYAVFEPNVRGSTGYGKAYTHLDDVERRMDAVADLKAGVDWLHDHPAVDPDRIAVMGASYGGFMTLAALTEYRRHRRHRQLRHVPREHGGLAAPAPRGRVRLARGRPRVPRVDQSGHPRRRDHRAAVRPPRRERPAGAGERGPPDRRGRPRSRRPRPRTRLRGRGPRLHETRKPDRGLRRDRRVPRHPPAGVAATGRRRPRSRPRPRLR
jgi:dipeptidyl aminopeptidase/acylaminoacyl peptidase